MTKVWTIRLDNAEEGDIEYITELVRAIRDAVPAVVVTGPGIRQPRKKTPAPTKPRTVDSRMLMSQRKTEMPAKAGITWGAMP